MDVNFVAVAAVVVVVDAVVVVDVSDLLLLWFVCFCVRTRPSVPVGNQTFETDAQKCC